MTAELLIEIPDALWMSSNQREHRMVVAKKTAAVRALAAAVARQASLPRMTQVHIGIEVGYPTARRADPPNAWPTAKAAIDGVVDSGALADDNSEVVWCHSFTRSPRKAPKGRHTLRLVLTDQQIPFLEGPTA